VQGERFGASGMCVVGLWAAVKGTQIHVVHNTY
jgi:hypothetical protein